MNPKRLPVRSPKINKKSTGVIANAHNECISGEYSEYLNHKDRQE
jgi:hypothetical protein